MLLYLLLPTTIMLAFYSRSIIRRLFSMASPEVAEGLKSTTILFQQSANLGQFEDPKTMNVYSLNEALLSRKQDIASLYTVVAHLKITDIPVAFPTETVYGLAADATRSGAVKGIYKAKGRPSDNPLIIHVSDLTMLRSLLAPATLGSDSIPAIYLPLIRKFWPGPLTIILPNPSPSKLAPEVTGTLKTFGARMPGQPIAQALIHLLGAPLAAPSANSSGKPSPTTAAHVFSDLEGKIELILDGGACEVGVESTVVDGLCVPPVVLRPGGVSIDEIRKIEGWESVVTGYQDASEIGAEAPRAPGMKYKHYSPKAPVILYEASSKSDFLSDISDKISPDNRFLRKIGIISTIHWRPLNNFDKVSMLGRDIAVRDHDVVSNEELAIYKCTMNIGAEEPVTIYEVRLGSSIKGIGKGLFAALRALDDVGVDIIYVEGIDDSGDIAAAIMNRLRKAASRIEG